MIDTKTLHANLLIPVGKIKLNGELVIPEAAKAIVIFAHGSGSSRHSPRNKFVAAHLNRHGLATLLVDLLTPKEEERDSKDGHLRFNISLLSERLGGIVKWTTSDKKTASLTIGIFGASTGAAAALVVAAHNPATVKSVVSRGGRVDLANFLLSYVDAPTLLIVGANDPEVLHLNHEALEKLDKNSALRIIPGASHLFEETGALEQVAELAAAWFKTHIG